MLVSWGVRALANVEPGRLPEGPRGRLLYVLCLWGVLWTTVALLLGENEMNWAAPAYVSVLALGASWLDRGWLRNGIRRPVGKWA